MTSHAAHQPHTQHATSTHLPSLTEELLEFLHAHALRELHAEHGTPVPILIRDIVSGRLLWAVATESNTGPIDKGVKWVFIWYCSSLPKGLWIWTKKQLSSVHPTICVARKVAVACAASSAFSTPCLTSFSLQVHIHKCCAIQNRSTSDSDWKSILGHCVIQYTLLTNKNGFYT